VVDAGVTAEVERPCGQLPKPISIVVSPDPGCGCGATTAHQALLSLNARNAMPQGGTPEWWDARPRSDAARGKRRSTSAHVSTATWAWTRRRAFRSSSRSSRPRRRAAARAGPAVVYGIILATAAGGRERAAAGSTGSSSLSARRAPEQQPAPRPAPGRTVLLVEDQSPGRRRVAQGWRYRVAARDGEGAVALPQRHRIDLSSATWVGLGGREVFALVDRAGSLHPQRFRTSEQQGSSSRS
jgi:hypothetical protein